MITSKDKVVIIGNPKMGKSTLAKEHILKPFQRRLVFDPTNSFGKHQKTLADAQQMYARYGKCTYQPGLGELTKKLDDFCRWAIQQSNAVILLDDLGVVCDRGPLPESFFDLFRMAHRRNMALVMTFHRIQGDAPSLVFAADHLFIFRCTIIFDLYTLRGVIGEDGAAWVAKAPKYQYWYRNAESGWQGPLISPQPAKTQPVAQPASGAVA